MSAARWSSLETALLRKLERITIPIYFVIFLGVVVVCGVAYQMLASYGHGNGIAHGSETLQNVDFWNALYFSIVTVSSLGYGDYAPLGWAKAVAALEVIFGLGWIGLAVARLTSRTMSHHVERLFSVEAMRQLDHYAAELDRVSQNILRALPSIARAFQRAPTPADQLAQEAVAEIQREQRDVLSTVEKNVEQLNFCATQSHEYLDVESQHGDFFEIVAAEPIVRFGKQAERAAHTLSQAVIALDHVGRAMLAADTRARITNVRVRLKALGQTVCKRTTNAEIRGCFGQVLETCDMISEAFYAAPADLAPMPQPDQRVISDAESQEPLNP